MTTPHEPYTERHLALVREAEGADGHTYCPPLQAPMSVHARQAPPAPKRYCGPCLDLGIWQDARRCTHGDYGITDANAPRVLRAIFEDDAERKDFGAAIMVWACIMGSVVGGAYLFAWLV